MMIRTVIIDDEEHVRTNLSKIAQINLPNIQIVGEADSVQSAVSIIKKEVPDLVFLDINLSDGTGFSVLEEIGDINVNVIFITAYDEYAIKAFRFGALDYLLKPVDTDDLKDAVSKLDKRLSTNFVTHQELTRILQSISAKEEPRKLAIPTIDSVVYLEINDIVRCEASSNYTTIYLVDGQKEVASRPLKEYESLLQDSSFFRVHQTHLINLSHVVRYTKSAGGFIMMADHSEVPIARRRKDEFLIQLNKIGS